MNLFSLCYHTIGYPKSHNSLNHLLPVLQYKSSMISITKRYQKDMTNMSYNVYHPKVKLLEKEKLEQADDLIWMLKTDF